MQIPIQNIYYLLCYAWNKLDERDRVSVSVEDSPDLLNLLTKVLLSATRILLKKGVDRNYTAHSEDLSGVKGKLELSATIKRSLQLKQRTRCSFDEFSTNTLPNQILVTTLHTILRIDSVDLNLKREARKLILMFGGVDRIRLKDSHFKKVKLHRNNRFYGFILNICQLILQHTLPSENSGKLQFTDFTRDEKKMNQLFEAFIRNFYKIEQSVYDVKQDIIKWRFTPLDEKNLEYLPVMKTDITLVNSSNKIIIDAKYYKETMAVHYEKERVKSANLYQLFSYLLNQNDGSSKTQNATGMLLYPTIEKDYDISYMYGNHQIHIKTLNLNTEWKRIEKRLKEIVNV